MGGDLDQGSADTANAISVCVWMYACLYVHMRVWHIGKNHVWNDLHLLHLQNWLY